MRKHSNLSLILAASMLTATAMPITMVPTPAYSESFGKKVMRDFGAAGRNLKKRISKGKGKEVLQVIGLGLAAYGIADNSAAAAIIGVTLVAAPEIFKKDMARNYGRELNWAGCTNCYKHRVITPPDRKISKKQRAAIRNRTVADVKDIQGALKKLGFYKKRIDGDFGPGTRAGVKEFQTMLGDRATGILTSEQRHRLFVRAEKGGYMRTASLNTIDDTIALKVADADIGQQAPSGSFKVASKTSKPVIMEFALAKSQFDKFADQFLTSGSQTVVTDATMMPDGSVSLDVKDLSSGEIMKLTGSISGFEVKPHQLAEEWARVTYQGDDGTATILNTRDDLGTAEDAALWIEKGQKSLTLLAKLTGDNEPPAQDKPETLLVEDTTPPPTDAKTIEVADIGTATISENEPAQPSSGYAQSGIIAPAADEICQQSLYVSWSFPNGESPINHYNVTPPEGVIMMDNGNSTAYFNGSCVLGDYDFSYVYIEKGKQQKDWKHHKRSGRFQIAQNAEQCSIDLNNPDGSARVECY